MAAKNSDDTIVNYITTKKPKKHEEIHIETTDITKLTDAIRDAWEYSIECIKIITENKVLRFLAAKKVIHICLFVDDTDEYVYDNGKANEPLVEIAGYYWSASEVCQDLALGQAIASHFYLTGKLLDTVKWSHRHSDWGT